MSDQRDAGINLPLISAIVGVATIGGFMFGYDSGVINGTQEGLKSTFNLSEAWLGITVSALLPGCAVGAFVAGRSADRWGRRRVMLAAAALFILSALASGAAASAVMMIVARFAAGVGVGAASVLSPAYISEVTPASMRGAWYCKSACAAGEVGRASPSASIAGATRGSRLNASASTR